MTWKSPLSTKFSAISRPYFYLMLLGFARVVSGVWDTWWRELERSNHWSSRLGGWHAAGNGTLWKPSCWEYSTIVEQAMTHKGCSADWRRRRTTTTTMVARTRLNITLYLHCVSCFSIFIIKFSCLVFFIYWIRLSLTRTTYHWWTARRALRTAFWETTLCKNLALTK